MILKPRLFRKLRYGPHWSKTGLVGLWLMNEGPGNIKVYDLSGNENTGTLISAVTWVAGKYGPALDFAGEGDWVLVPDNGTLRFNSATQDFSVFAWVKNDVGVPDDVIIDKRDGNDDGWALRTIAGVVWLSVNEVDVKGTIDIGDGKWHSVGATANRSGNGQVYIDGLPDGNPVDVSGQAMDTTITVRIGGTSFGTGNPWDGKMSHIPIYNRVLTATEVADLNRNPFIMFDRDEIELWPAATIGAAPATNDAIMTTNTGFWGVSY